MELMLDFKAIHEVLVEDADHFRDRSLYNNAITDPITQNLIELDGTAWKQLHVKTKHLWLKEIIQATVSVLMRMSKNFELTLTDISSLVDQFNMNVIGSVAFGVGNDDKANSLAFICSNLVRWMHYRLFQPESTQYFLKIDARVNARPVYAFLPFGLGFRSCVAQQFVTQQLLIGLMTLLNLYSFAPCKKTSIPLTYDNGQFFLQPKPSIELLMKST
uniref:Cytochrome P450 n=1 Tax=Glossina brevipalpis TaxID=37001 RepID=A0A1A9X3V1_9MUSC